MHPPPVQLSDQKYPEHSFVNFAGRLANRKFSEHNLRSWSAQVHSCLSLVRGSQA